MSAALHNIDLIFLVWNFLIWSYTVFVGWFSARLLWDQYSVFKPHAHCMWLSSVFTAATLQCMNGTQSAVPVLSLTNIQGIPRLGCEHCCNGRFCTSILVPSSPAVRLLVSSALPDAAKPSSKALHTPGKSSTLLRVQSTFEKYIPHGRWFKKKKKKVQVGFHGSCCWAIWNGETSATCQKRHLQNWPTAQHLSALRSVWRECWRHHLYILYTSAAWTVAVYNTLSQRAFHLIPITILRDKYYSTLQRWGNRFRA